MYDPIGNSSVNQVSGLSEDRVAQIKSSLVSGVGFVNLGKLGKLEHDTLYLLEYPDGYILAFNNLMLAFNGS